MSGFYGIGIENSKFKANLGTLFRSAQAFGADFIFTIGNRYAHQSGDTGKSWQSVPLFHYDSFEQFNESKPKSSVLIGVEINESSKSLKNFCHPKRAIYLLGAEDYGLSEKAAAACNYIVEVPTSICLNVATTGSIIMYDRSVKTK